MLGYLTVNKFHDNESIPYHSPKVTIFIKCHYLIAFAFIFHSKDYVLIKNNSDADNIFYHFLSTYWGPSILPDTSHTSL